MNPPQFASIRLPWLGWLPMGLLGLICLFSGIVQIGLLPGWVDAGIYLGYALNFPALIERYPLDPVTYQGARLSYVLIRYSLHQAFGPEAAQVLELSGIYLLSLAAVFLLGWRRCGPGATRLAAGFLAFNPLFLSSLVFGGTDGFTVLCLLAAAVAWLSPSAIELAPKALLIGGVFAGAALIAHLFAVVPLAGLAITHLWLAKPPLFRFPRYVWVLAGVAAISALCGMIGYVFGLDFLFFRYFIEMAERSFTQGVGPRYRLPLDAWIFGSYRVLIPLFLTVFAGSLLFRWQALRKDRFLMGTFLGFSATTAFYLAWDFLLQGVVIQTRSYFNLLVPGAVLLLLGIGGALHRKTSSVPGAWIFLLLPGLLIGLTPAAPAILTANVVQFSMLVVLLAVFACVLVAGLHSRSDGAWSTVVLAFLLACCAAMNADSLRVFRRATDLDYRQAYLGSVRFVEWLETSGLAHAKPKIWFDRDGLNRRQQGSGTYSLKFKTATLALNYFDTLASLYLWHRSLLSDRLDLSEEAAASAREARVIIFLTQDEAQIAQAAAVLADRGLNVREVGVADYDAPDFGWHARAFARVASFSPSG